MQPRHLPPDAALILRYSRGPLKTVSVRLDPETLEALEQLSEQMGSPKRAGLLRLLLTKGITAMAAELQALEAVG